MSKGELLLNCIYVIERKANESAMHFKIKIMDTMNVERRMTFPYLRNRKNRMLFYVVNLYLLIGIGGLLITMFYLIGHLYEADKVIVNCIPGFLMGISSGVIYYVGYQSLNSEKNGKKQFYRT